MKKVLISLLVLIALLLVAVKYRWHILLPLATTGAPVELDRAMSTVPDSIPFGDDEVYVTLQLDERTFAIAEPYSWTRNFNYLFIGDDRALLFDAGIGHYDIRPVVASLTKLPITFIPSHFHYDHTGQVDFPRRAMVDLPHLRARADGDKLTPAWGEFLGSAEGVEAPTWQIDEWIKPGEKIELGNRSLTLMFTPGHTDNSISLYDSDSKRLFSGDFISKNQMNAYYPGGSLGDYLQSAEKILSDTDPATTLYGAHSQTEPDLPEFVHAEVEILRDQIRRIKSGELTHDGVYPVSYQITPAQVILAEHPLLQSWDITPEN